MLVREFIPNDIKRILEIENMSFDERYGFNMFMKLYDVGAGFLVAEIEGYVVGYVLFWLKEENEGHIISIAVDRNYRRLNVGSTLLSNALVILKKFNVDCVSLEVNENNSGAVEFYKNFDFEVDRTVPNYYNNGDGAIVMSLELHH